MRKSRFTEPQVIGMIKEQEAGMPTAQVSRKYGLSQGTFYNFKSKYGGMEVSDAAKLRALEDENAKFKRLLVDGMLSNEQARSCHRSDPARERSGNCLPSAVRATTVSNDFEALR